MSVSSNISGSGFGITKTGGGTLTLSGTNTYTGDTTVNAGTLALNGGGSIANSPNIVIGGGATFDVSTLTTALTLASGQGLKTTGTVSAAIINTSAGKGLTTAADSPLQLSYYTLGGSVPLGISGNGTVTLQSGNPVTVTVSGGIPLAAGNYTMISKGTNGAVAGTAPTSVTVNGDGLAPLSTASLSITGSQLVLNVTTIPASTIKFRSKQTGNWNATSTWETSTDGNTWVSAVTTPDSTNDTITIQNGHIVTVTANVAADQLTVNAGGILSVAGGVTFTVADGTGTDLTVAYTGGVNGILATAGQITNNGQAQIDGTLRIDEGGFPGGTGTYAYNQTTGALFFNNTSGPYGVNNFNFWPASNGPQNVSVASGGITMNVARTVGVALQTSGPVNGANNLTLNGLFTIFAGGYASGSPTYGASSTLQYATGGTYARAGEWLATTSNPGYPANVQITALTTLDAANGPTFNTAPSQIGGNLTIDAQSALSMGAMTQPITVVGDVNINGTLTLSTASGGDIKLQGNWSDAGTFNPNGRAVFFEGGNSQTISRTGGETFNYLVVNKTASAINLSSNVEVNGTSGNALQITGSSSLPVNLSGNTLTMSGDGGSLLVSGGSRKFVNTGGTLAFTGSKSIVSASGGTLVVSSQLTVNLFDAVNFGAGVTTIEGGTLVIKSGGSVDTNPPTYTLNAVLRYDTGGPYNTGAEFPSTGVPSVEVQSSTTQLNLDSDKTVTGFDAEFSSVGSTTSTPRSLTAVNLNNNSSTLTLNNLNVSGNAYSSGTLNIAGNWNVATFAAGTNTVNFNGTGAQTIQTANTFDNLTASNDVTLGAATTVNGTLTLGSKKITTGAFTLSLGNSASVTRTSGYVLGTLQKSFNAPASFTFPVGTANAYSPVDANSTTGTGSLSVKPTQTKHPNIAGTKALSRYWTLNGSGITTNLTFHYLDTDAVGSEGIYKIFRYSGGTFTQFEPTQLNTNDHNATLNGVNSFSDWTLAESSAINGELQFSASNYDTAEGNSGTHNVTVTVQRAGGSQGAVSVHYVATNGTASSGDGDFDQTSGDLNWADGDSADKTFDVVVHGDTVIEPDETISLQLSSPTGGSALGSTSVATITIKNDDVALPPATLVVNTAADTDDGSCSTDPAGCTLREAINAANVSADANTINFNIPTSDANYNATTGLWTISPTSALPTISSPATIDGYTQAGASPNTNATGALNAVLKVVLSGQSLASGSGLTVTASNSTVRGLVINGFAGGAAVVISGATGCSVAGNYIGTDAAGTSAVANGVGVRVQSGATNNFVGTNGDNSGDAAERNLISGNSFQGVWVKSTGTSGNVIAGNLIGTDAAGASALANNCYGVSISDSSGNTVGGLTSAALNVVSGNKSGGVELDGAGATGNVVEGNYIGVAADGTTALGNTAGPCDNGDGVVIDDGPVGNTVGSTAAGASNIIANNNGAGILLYGPSVTNNNNIRGNSVFSNGGLGIDLGAAASAANGVTANDAGDADSGVNNLQNFPVITSAVAAGSTLRIDGTLNSTPSSTFVIDFYANSSCDASGYGEGQTYLGSVTTAASDANGDVAFTFNPSSLTAGQFVTATATDPAGNTSEFSQCSAATSNTGTIQFASATYGVGEGGGSVTLTVKRTGSSVGAVGFNYATADGTATAAGGSDYLSQTGGISWLNGDASDKTIVITITDDAVHENATEDFTVTLSNPSGGAVIGSPSTATVTITDDDPEPALSIDDVTHLEGDSSTTAYLFTVTKSSATALPVSVDFATHDGTATVANGDYQSNSGTLNFAADQNTQQFTVLVNGDTTVEPDETFTVQLSNVSGATIGDDTGTGTITNDDARPTPTTVYVDDDWASVPNGADPDGAGPATEMGYDAFAKIQDGVGGVAANGTVNVYEGTYDEDVNVNKAGLTVTGIGAGTKTVRGAIGGDTATFHITASNVTVAGFIVTRLGNNTTDWNNPGLNAAGFAVQGQAVTGTLIRDNVITGNRTGVDINNSNGNTVRNNSITDNRTGAIFRNQTDSTTFVENFVTDNWTVGVLFLDASGGTNSPAQSAHGSVFSNNNLSGNWYGQIVDRQSGGSLPAPGTTNLKNFRGDWFGTTSPVVTTANSAEPGYAAQIPVEFGGSATAPGGQPDIAGPASANFVYQPLLLSGADTNVETVSGRGTNGFQGVGVSVTIRQPSLHGWQQQDTTCGASSTGSQSFVVGPSTPPAGEGSLQYSIGSDGDSFETIRNPDLGDTRLAALTSLAYSTYVTQDGAGGQAPYLLLNIDFDDDGAVDDQLFFEPVYQSSTYFPSNPQGPLAVGAWQTWDALHGGWWSTGGVAGANPGTDVKSLAAYIAAQPNARIVNGSTGTGGFRIATGCGAGSWDNFVGSADDLRYSVSGAGSSYDLEPLPRVSVGNVTHDEGDSGTTAFDFHVTLSAASDQTVTVDYETADDTATTADGDYQPDSSAVTFNPGETDKTVTVFVNGDTKYEPDETFFLNISNPNANATILGAQGTGTITNDDPPIVSASIDDVFVAEPASGTSTAKFTVTLSGPAPAPASIHYATSDDTASAGSDYTAASGTLNFDTGDSSATITVTVNSDAQTEGPEKFNVTLSSPTGPLTIADGTGVGTITDPVASGQVIISEFRPRGPAGAQDEFVELYNTTANPITVATEDGTPGWGLSAVTADGSAPDPLTVIPAGTIIPPHAHYLVADVPAASPASGYSLPVTPDLTYDCDIDDGTGVALFRTADPASFAISTRMDAAGFSNILTPTADLFREGAGLASPGANDGEYSFVRKMLTGLPQDTDDNANDFIFVSTDAGSYGGVQSALGAPGPENSGSPLNRGALIKSTLFDPAVTLNDAPNRQRFAVVVANGAHGTLVLRRTFNNSTGDTVKKLRFRVVDVTTAPQAADNGTADLRLLDTVQGSVSTSGGSKTWVDMPLETPPAQPNGGGYNSAVVATLPDGGLTPGDSINIQFTLGVQQAGSFRFFIIVEALTDSDPTAAADAASPPKHGPDKPSAVKPSSAKPRKGGDVVKIN